jgi:hypothetical protein
VFDRFKGTGRRAVSSTRRELITGGLRTAVAASVLPSLWAEDSGQDSALRSINFMNFIRAEEPRASTDLPQPLREQMALIRKHQFPATWLLQYDAMVEGPFVEFLKAEMPEDHEVGIWFEMNQKICEEAGIAWRGNPNWEWDFHVPVAYSIGYTNHRARRLGLLPRGVDGGV